MSLMEAIRREIDRLEAAEEHDEIELECSRADSIEKLVRSANEINRTQLQAARMAYDMGLGTKAEKMLGE